jgi:hypothetical protein
MSKPEVISERLMLLFNQNKCRPMYYTHLVRLYHKYWNGSNKRIFAVLEQLVAKGKIDKINNHYGLDIKQLLQTGDLHADYVFPVFQKLKGKAINLQTLQNFLKRRGMYSNRNFIRTGRKILYKKGLIVKLDHHYGVPDENGNIEKYNKHYHEKMVKPFCHK